MPKPAPTIDSNKGIMIIKNAISKIKSQIQVNSPS